MIIAVLLTFIIFIIVAYIAYDFYVHHSRFGQLINKIPGPKPLPIIGNILIYQVGPEKLWPLLRYYTDKYYPIIKIWNLLIPTISIRHPDDLEVILSSTKHIDKGMIYDILHPWLNTGLLTSAGVKWHSRRKILTPAFHFNILRQFVDILLEEGERMTKILKNAGGPVEKNIIHFISEHTLNAICETAMGTSLHSLGELQEKYRQDIHQMSFIVIHRLFRPWLYWDLTFGLSPTGRLQKKIIQDLHGFTDKIVTERKIYHERTKGQYLQNFTNASSGGMDDEEIYGSRKKRLAMLDLLIAASQENHLSDSDIREEVDTFMFEGHDTTAMTICFTLLLLAEHKDIQDRVREEVNTVIEECGGKWTMASLQNLTYLERCLKESMRLYPAVHFISRVAGEDAQLRSHLIPSGTIIHLNIYSVHRDANFWPNPEEFDPDRFLPDKIQNRHPYSYLPFSAGPRNCIGQRFAMWEMKAMIAPIIRNFYLESIDYLKDMQICAGLILRPKHPMRLRFVPIEVA
uniref:uncharacterized LOC105181718 n=1 Tax=Harpegnathos saltator TaxID=610380 RepID=UPI0009490568